MFEKIMEFLASGEYKLSVRWLDKQTYGLIERDKEIITVNFVLLMAETLIHEFLHYHTGSDNERNINRMTTLLLKKLTVEQIGLIVAQFLKHVE